MDISGYQTHCGVTMLYDVILRQNLVIFGSGNGLSPVRPQTMMWTNVDLLLIGHLGTNFNKNESKCNDLYCAKCIWKVVYKKSAILSRPRYVNTDIYKMHDIIRWYQYDWHILTYFKDMGILYNLWIGWFNQMFHFVWNFFNATSLWI